MTSGLIDVFYSPALFQSYEEQGSVVLFGFSDGKTVDVDRTSTPVFSAMDGTFPAVERKRGFWTVNGSRSGISYDDGVGNMLSKIVCLAYDCNAVYMYMSNGNVLHIPSTEEGSLWGFSFLLEDNAFLPKTIECTVNGCRIVGDVPSGVLGHDLCPCVNYRGAAISVNSIPQRNRNSRLDFSGKVEYVLTLFDESTIKYTVTMNEPYPSIWIDTDGKPIQHRSYSIPGKLRIVDPEHKYWSFDEFEATMQIRGRGNSTWTQFPKKPYKIKLDEKADIFGMGKNRDWVLMANYADKSLLRNTTGMMVSEICGMTWTPRVFNVDVYLNKEYIGSYDFTEHKEVAKHRVDIDVDAGDCYLEIEAKKDKPEWFDTSMGFPIMFSEPEHPSAAVKNEIIQYFHDFELALKSPYFADPQKGYPAYVDVDSFINHYIIQELAKNIDADLFKSLFLVKRKDGKLEFYHVWDFDLAFGNCNYLNAHQGVSTGPEGWYIRDHTQQGINTGWYYYMFKDPDFAAKVKSRWIELYPELAKVPEVIYHIYEQMRGSAGRNFDRWDILDKYVWPNKVWLGSYPDEVDYMLEFYTQRLEWMNSEITTW